MNSDDGAITELLTRWKQGDRSVETELVELVYPLLRQIAAAQVRRNSGALTLQATELANEAYSKLVKLHGLDWQSRDHFFAVAATVIRRVVIDYLRQRGSAKRGGGLPLLAIDEVREDQLTVFDESVDWIGLDEAMTELATVDRSCARVVELKFFSGLTNDKIADVCGISVPTVVRQWRFARAWLGKRMGVDASPA
jgi:RNA polymerase sigma factor (TIGR02999 family)